MYSSNIGSIQENDMSKTNLKCGKLKGKSASTWELNFATSGIQTDMFFQDRDFTGSLLTDSGAVEKRGSLTSTSGTMQQACPAIRMLQTSSPIPASTFVAKHL
jgi:hypothetical protein